MIVELPTFSTGDYKLLDIYPGLFLETQLKPGNQLVLQIAVTMQSRVLTCEKVIHTKNDAKDRQTESTALLNVKD